jgi:dTDP-glucose pyrophosphorylase
MAQHFDPEANAVIGLMHTNHLDMIKRNYTVSLNSNKTRILSLVEKPEQINSNILGVGSYLFEPSIFEAIRFTPPGKKNEIEITDSINTLCNMENIVVRPYFLEGLYLNVTYPEDVAHATKLIQQDPNQAHL